MGGVGTVANIISGIISTSFIYIDTTNALLPESETLDDLGHALQMSRDTLENLMMVFTQVEKGDFEVLSSLGIKVNSNKMTKITHCFIFFRIMKLRTLSFSLNYLLILGSWKGE